MTKVFEFQWQIVVPESLLRGDVFDRLDEVRLRCANPHAEEACTQLLILGRFVLFL